MSHLLASTLPPSVGLECRTKAEAAKPRAAAVNDVHAVITGTESEAAAASGTASSSPEATVKASNDGAVVVIVEPAATVPKNNTAARTPIQVPDGSSSGSADVNDAPAAFVQTAAGEPSVLVQISDVDQGTSDGEVRVDIVSVTPSQKPAESAALSVEVSDGHTDMLDGSVKVDVTAVTAAQTAREHKSDTGAGTASGQQDDTRCNSLAALHPSTADPRVYWDHESTGNAFNKVGSQPSKVSNWLMDDSNQAGSEVEAGSASGNRASRFDEKPIESDPSGTGSDEDDDDTVVQVTVDRSLLG